MNVKMNLLILPTLVLGLFFNSAAQNVHQAKVLGVVSLGKQDIAMINDLTSGSLYKTATYKRGLLIANEAVQLDFSNAQTDERAKVLKSGLSQNIFAFKEGNPLSINSAATPNNNRAPNLNTSQYQSTAPTTITTSSNTLTFDGIDDYLETTTPVLDIIADGDFTFETWINGDEALNGNHPAIMGNRPAGQMSNGEVFFFHNIWGGSIAKMLAVRLDDRNYVILNNGTYNGSLLDGTCHHIAITRAGSLLSFYADGVLFGTTGIVGNPNIATGENVRIGGDKVGGIPYKGTMGDLRVWNVARSALEIFSSKDVSLTGNEPNLIANWEMNEGTGQIAIDKVAGANAHLGSTTNIDNNDPVWTNDGCKEIIVNLAIKKNKHRMSLKEFKANASSQGEINFFKQNPETDNTEFTSSVYDINNRTVIIEPMESMKGLPGRNWFWTSCKSSLGICAWDTRPGPFGLSSQSQKIDNLYNYQDEAKVVMTVPLVGHTLTSDGYLPIGEDIFVKEGLILKKGIYKANYSTKRHGYTAVAIDIISE